MQIDGTLDRLYTVSLSYFVTYRIAVQFSVSLSLSIISV